MTINYDLNQALIRLRAAMVELDDVMNNKVSRDEFWTLAHKYPFGCNMGKVAKAVQEWTDAHIEKDEDEE